MVERSVDSNIGFLQYSRKAVAPLRSIYHDLPAIAEVDGQTPLMYLPEQRVCRSEVLLTSVRSSV